MVSIYSEIISSRLEYICEFIFENVLSTEFKLFSNLEEFKASKGVKLNYSDSLIENSNQIFPSGLLQEKGVEKQEFQSGEWNGLKTIFSTKKGNLPFDVFSACFYLITRYEEYLPHETDKHHRYLPEQSILSQLEVLEIPVVDKWCLAMARKFDISIGKKSYNYLSTIDVDNTYAYKAKSLGIKIGGTAKSLLKGDTADVKRRLGVYFGAKSDPYDTYNHISEVHEKHQVNSMYFFLLSNRNEWDKNLPFSNRQLRELVLALQRKSTIGIHPGYTSYLDKKTTQTEMLRLESITGEAVAHSRQHFLKFKFPETAQNLADLGIQHDYSLGYASVLGFRAGTCTPFKFYNLSTEKSTDLVMHSSPIMDATLNNYLKVGAESALQRVENIIKEVKEVKGELVTIWHNETLSDIREWKGWKAVFEKIVSLASKES